MVIIQNVWWINGMRGIPDENPSDDWYSKKCSSIPIFPIPLLPGTRQVLRLPMSRPVARRLPITTFRRHALKANGSPSASAATASAATEQPASRR
ncbi:Protein of unknown function, partial [Gryllus bimaculatus]